MIIYYSMMAWIGIIYFFFKLSPKSKIIDSQEGYRVSIALALFTFSYIVFWAGMRTGYIDTGQYIYNFEHCKATWSEIFKVWKSDNKSPGFITFQILFKKYVSNDFHWWLMCISVIQGICVCITLQKKSVNFFYSSTLFILTLNFTWMLNGIRQFIVATIIFLLSDLVENRKTIPFIVAVLLLSTIHYTALIMIPVYFFVTDKPFGKKVIIFILLLLMAVVFLQPFMSGVEDVLQNTRYNGYSLNYDNDDGVNPIRVIVALVPVAISFLYRQKIEEADNRYINIAVNMSVISAGLYFLGVFTSGILVGRLPIYFELYNLILLPYLFDTCFNNKDKQLLYILCSIGYFMFFYLQSGNMYYISDITGYLK